MFKAVHTDVDIYLNAALTLCHGTGLLQSLSHWTKKGCEGLQADLFWHYRRKYIPSPDLQTGLMYHLSAAQVVFGCDVLANRSRFLTVSIC